MKKFATSGIISFSIGLAVVLILQQNSVDRFPVRSEIAESSNLQTNMDVNEPRSPHIQDVFPQIHEDEVRNNTLPLSAEEQIEPSSRFYLALPLPEIIEDPDEVEFIVRGSLGEFFETLDMDIANKENLWAQLFDSYVATQKNYQSFLFGDTGELSKIEYYEQVVAQDTELAIMKRNLSQDQFNEYLNYKIREIPESSLSTAQALQSEMDKVIEKHENDL